MELDHKVGVKFFKLKLLSNLITHTLPGSEREKAEEIYKIVECFKGNKYRSTLISES